MLKKFLTRVGLLLWLFIGIGCATPGEVRIEDRNVPLDELTRLVQTNLPLGVRRFTQNGRDFYSNYFTRGKDGEFVSATSAPVRYHAHVSILNDRRPYDIAIRVIAERRAPDGQYDQVGYDEGLARVLSRRIQQALHQRREDRNLIDDFRPF